MLLKWLLVETGLMATPAAKSCKAIRRSLYVLVERAARRAANLQWQGSLSDRRRLGWRCYLMSAALCHGTHSIVCGCWISWHHWQGGCGWPCKLGTSLPDRRRMGRRCYLMSAALCHGTHSIVCGCWIRWHHWQGGCGWHCKLDTSLPERRRRLVIAAAFRCGGWQGGCGWPCKLGTSLPERRRRQAIAAAFRCGGWRSWHHRLLRRSPIRRVHRGQHRCHCLAVDEIVA